VKAALTGLLVQALARARPRTLDWYRQTPSLEDRRL